MKNTLFIALSFLVASQVSAQEPKKLPKALHNVLEIVKNNPNAGKPNAPVMSMLNSYIDGLLVHGDDRRLRPFRSPISIDDLKRDGVPASLLALLERVPKADSKTFEALENTVDERVHYLTDKLIAVPIPDSVQKEYDEAMAYLYKDGKPTPQYQAYLDYEKERKRIGELLRKAETQKEQILLQMELRRLEDKRLLMLNYHEMIRKMEGLRRMEYYKQQQDIDIIRADFSKEHKPELRMLKSATTSGSGWFNLGFSTSADGVVMIDGQPVISQVSKIDSSIARIPVDWPTLHNSTVMHGVWKSEDYVLSDGDPKTESSKEVLPRLNHELILGKDFQMTFDSASTVSAIQSAVNEGRKVTVSGMELSKDKVSFEGNKLKINTTQAIGVIDRDVEKKPH